METSLVFRLLVPEFASPLQFQTPPQLLLAVRSGQPFPSRPLASLPSAAVNSEAARACFVFHPRCWDVRSQNSTGLILLSLVPEFSKTEMLINNNVSLLAVLMWC